MYWPLHSKLFCTYRSLFSQDYQPQPVQGKPRSTPCSQREGCVHAPRPLWTCKEGPRPSGQPLPPTAPTWPALKEQTSLRTAKGSGELVRPQWPWPMSDRHTQLTTSLLSFSRKFFQPENQDRVAKAGLSTLTCCLWRLWDLSKLQCVREGVGSVRGSMKCRGGCNLSREH